MGITNMKTYKITWVIYDPQQKEIDSQLTFFMQGKSKKQIRQQIRINLDRMYAYIEDNNYNLQLSIEKTK